MPERLRYLPRLNGLESPESRRFGAFASTRHDWAEDQRYEEGNG